MRSSKVQTLVKALVILMLCSSYLLPQTGSKTYSLKLKACVLRQLDNNSNIVYSTAPGTSFGYIPFAYGDPESKYRSVYEVELPSALPMGAYIKQVDIIYKNKAYGPGEGFSLYYIPIYSFDDTWTDSLKWNVTETGTYMRDMGVSTQNINVPVFRLEEPVNKALDEGNTKLYLGFRAYPEWGTFPINTNGFQYDSLRYTYEIRVRDTIKNISGNGKIDVSINNQTFSEVNSGEVLKLNFGTVVQLRAKEEQNDGTYFWVWNQDPNTSGTTRSSWLIKNGEVPFSSDIQYSYITKKEYLYSSFTADIKKKFIINRIDKTEFDGSSQTNDIARVVEGNSLNIPYSEILTKTTGTYNFAGWESGGTALKTPTDNTTYTALYKMPQKSNTQTAFSNSGQRKFIMTPQANHQYGGDLHMVYESMGKIWYERSADGGNTWVIENGGKPLNTDYVYTSGWQYTGSGSYTVAKHPSIDYYQDRVVILWQEQSGSNYVVRICFMQNGTHTGPANCIPFTTYGQYSEDIWPEIAVKDGGKAAIAIRRNDPYLKGLEIHYMTLYPEGGLAQEETSGWITGTDQNTGMFSLAADRSNTDKFHIAWQQNGTTSSIQYAKFNFTYSSGEINVAGPNSASSAGALVLPPPEGQWSMNILKTVNVSRSTGYSQSYCPSMIGVSDGSARLAFKGYKRNYYGSGGTYSISSCCPDNMSWIPYLRKYSGDVFSPQISLGSETYFVAWTELLNGSYRTIATDASTLSNKETVDGSFGRDIQINNGGLRNQQYSMGFNSESTSLPYSFKRSTALGDIQANKKAPELSGRGIYLNNGESQVYFILGNVTSGGEIIGFTEAHDSVSLDGDLKKVNHYMTTEAFSLKENSKLTFAAICGTKDSLITSSLMKNGQFASFTLEMIDEASGRVLASYMKERIDKKNVFSLKESIFKLNSDGIVNRQIRLRVSVDENMKSRYTISEMLLGGGIPLSKASKEMDVEASSVVKEYSLTQNYPNPFNPTTLISYALPKASKVTLKVYDILGKEVATLVNDYREMGKYSAEFNASSLPSGTYIYEIRANDFVKSGKMMLLK